MRSFILSLLILMCGTIAYSQYEGLNPIEKDKAIKAKMIGRYQLHISNCRTTCGILLDSITGEMWYSKDLNVWVKTIYQNTGVNDEQ